MTFIKKNIEKKIKQKQLRLSEKNNAYLNKISGRFKVSEADIVNILLSNLGQELNFIEECEESLKILKENNLNFKRNIKIITNPISSFIGYYPINNINYFAYEKIEIFLENSFDRNFNYFISYQKRIDIYKVPNSAPYTTHFFNESKYINDLYNEFKEQGLNINNLLIDKNYNDFRDILEIF